MPANCPQLRDNHIVFPELASALHKGPCTSSALCRAAGSKSMASQIAAHAEGSFEAEVARHLRTLREAARRLTGSIDEADDLVQDAVMRAWTFWERFEPGSNSRAWLHRILVNTFINAYRKRRRERDLYRAAAEETRREHTTVSLLRQSERDGLGDEVGAALRALPNEFRAVVELVDLHDLSYREVASELGCPIGTVMSRLHRGRKQLHGLLEDYALTVGYTPEAALPEAAQAMHAA
jgi:RNA polymerase sigma-70 factor (ECF subfamily)